MSRIPGLTFPSRRLWAWVGVALLVLLAGFAWTCRKRFSRPIPPPVVLVLDAPEAWGGIPEGQRLGILLLLKDYLEVHEGLTVVEDENLRAASELASSRLVIAGTRSGQNLALDLRWTPVDGRETQVHTESAPPQRAFQGALESLGWTYRSTPELLPRDAGNFWDLAEATGCREDQDPASALEIARRLVEKEPRCAAAWATFAALSYWQLYRESATSDKEAFRRCDGIFRRAFGLVPHYPRAADDFAGFATDIGNGREALNVLFAAVKAYPNVAHLRGALAYPARVSGLLEGALRALELRDCLGGPHRFERDLVENTYLYCGRTGFLEADLGPGSDGRAEPCRDFYRGYVRLLRGDTAQAKAYFARAQGRPGSWIQFERLAKVLELHLSGNRSQALEELKALRESRLRLKVPDGEFTFKLAETFAYLGEDDEALGTAALAFGQGFGCTRWYRENPFLARLHSRPAWNALVQHVEERQRLLEQAYPASRFGK